MNKLKKILFKFDIGKIIIALYRCLNIKFQFKKFHSSNYGFLFRGNQIYIDENYEPHIKKFVCSNANKYSLMINLGAHHGIYPLILATMNIRSIAIEPDPRNYEVLVSNVFKNNYGELINCLYVAVGGTNELRQFYGTGSTGSLNDSMTFNEINDARVVQVLELKSILKSFSNIDDNILIIMDVEGSEYEILSSMEKSSFENSIDFIVEILFSKCLIDLDYKYDTQQLFSIMFDYGYSARSLIGLVDINYQNFQLFLDEQTTNDDILFYKLS
jgi:FkbM family methyltransferase